MPELSVGGGHAAKPREWDFFLGKPRKIHVGGCLCTCVRASARQSRAQSCAQCCAREFGRKILFVQNELLLSGSALMPRLICPLLLLLQTSLGSRIPPPAVPQTVLVTGGVGYIGSHTVLELLSAGHEVMHRRHAHTRRENSHLPPACTSLLNAGAREAVRDNPAPACTQQRRGEQRNLRLGCCGGQPVQLKPGVPPESAGAGRPRRRLPRGRPARRGRDECSLCAAQADGGRRLCFLSRGGAAVTRAGRA